MAGILDAISAFTVLPGQRKRFEAALQASIDQINAASTARIREQQAATEEQLRLEAEGRQAIDTELKNELFANAKAQGLDDQSAAAKASSDFYAIRTSPAYEALTTARLNTKRMEGAMPIAPKIGEAMAQAEYTDQAARQAENLRRMSTAAAGAVSDPLTANAEAAARQREASFRGTAANAQESYVPGLTARRAASESAGLMNNIRSQEAAAGFVPQMATTAAKRDIAGNQAEAAKAGFALKTTQGMDPNLASSAANAQTAEELANAELLSRYPGLNPKVRVPSMGGMTTTNDIGYVNDLNRLRSYKRPAPNANASTNNIPFRATGKLNKAR